MARVISVREAVDLHIHSFPCLFPRLADDRETVEAAIHARMGGLVLKCHHESTASRAYLLDQEYPEIRVFGGIVLNNYVGGINPVAVEAALAMGAKEVWMPTVHAENHARAYGGIGRYDVQEAISSVPSEGILILRNGELLPEVRIILDLIAEYDAILGTAHLSKQEISVLVPVAREHGVRKILLTHPYFKVPGLDLPFVREMVEHGAVAEFGYCTVSPMWHYATFEQVAHSIKTLGAEKCVLISDAGQPHNPIAPEALRIFSQSLHEHGISEEELMLMMVDNPKRLLGIG